MQPNDYFYKSTDLAPIYVSRSERLKSLSIDTQDHRKEIIDTTGSIAINLAKVAVTAGAPLATGEALLPLTLPVVIPLQDAKEAPTGSLPGNKGWIYIFKFLDDPSSKLPRTDFDKGSHGRSIALSTACRSAQLTVTNGTVDLTFGLTVADPAYIDTIPLPIKGEVDFPELCGPASVKTEKSTQSPTTELSDAVFKQISDLQGVFKKPSGKSTSSPSAHPTTSTDKP